jgi:HK97 family phage major capsid protein
MTLKELQEQRNKLAAEIRSLAEKHKSEDGWAAEDEQEWTRVNEAYDVTMRDIESAKQVEERQALLAKHDDEPQYRFDPVGSTETRNQVAGDGISEQDRCAAMSAWFRSQLGIGLSERERDICGRVGMNVNSTQLRVRLPHDSSLNELARAYRSFHPSQARDRVAESRAMSSFSFGSGGALVPDSFIRSLELNMLAFGGVRQVATTITTASGERMAMPTADDTSNQGERLGESASIGSSVEPSFGAVYWDAYKYSSKAILVPYELLEDSFVNLPVYLGQIMGERIARKTATDFTTGTGASAPKGIVTAATLGKTAGSATAITADEIFDLVHSVDPAYRSGAGFMMHDNIVLYLRKLKDAEGRYLWQNGMSDGAPDRIAGYPLTVSMEMASAVTTGLKTILFGQLSKYYIRRVNEIRIYRLEERYRDNDQDGFVAFVREDGNLMDAGTAPVKYLQQG